MASLRSALVLSVLSCLLPNLAAGGVIRNDVADREYLNLGARPQFASVGRLVSTLGTGTLSSSGILIAPDVVLTAAHPLHDALALSFTVGGSIYQAAQWAAYPFWTGDLTAGYDIGIIKLDSAVSNVAPAERYTGHKEVGKVVTLVGYGMTGTGISGATAYDRQKRAGTNRIDSQSAGSGKSARLLWMDFDSPSTTGKRGATPLEFLTATGDSGGGLFLDTSAGPLLAGVASFGYSLDGRVDGSYGEQAAFTRVSAFNDWIDTMIQRFTLPAGFLAAVPARPGLRDRQAYSPVQISVPEPGAAALAAVGCLLLLGHARRRRTG